MRIILGSDHGGYEMKEAVKNELVKKGIEIVDVGDDGNNPEDDYVDYAKAAIKAVGDQNDRLILFCRNGFGMSIVANRVRGVRCGFGFDVEAVRKGRVDDDINALAIPSDYVSREKVMSMIEVFLHEEFSNQEKYQRRLDKIDN